MKFNVMRPYEVQFDATFKTLAWTSLSPLKDIAPTGVSVTVLILWRAASGVGHEFEYSLSLSWNHFILLYNKRILKKIQ